MNLVEALTELGIEHRLPGEHHHVTRDFIGIDCPFCSPDEGRFLLGIHAQKMYASCWKCGYHSIREIFWILGKRTGKSWEIFWKLNQRSGNYASLSTKIQETERRKLEIPKGVAPMLQVHRQYLEKRGFDPDSLANFWGIRGIGLTGKLPWRLWIPIYENGKMVSWTTRSLSDSVQRYVNAPKSQESVPAKSLLFGEDHCRHAVIITEGPFDVFRIGPGAIATMGLAWSRKQLLKMSAFPVRVVCFDSETLAQQRAKKLCRELEAFPGKTYRVELDSEDPGMATKKEIKLLRKYLD